MNSKLKKTYQKIQEKKIVTFQETKSLLEALGCQFKCGAGSRVRFSHGTRILKIHKPHPGNELKKYAVSAVKDFIDMIEREKDE